MGGGGWGAGFRLGVGVSHLVGSASAWSVRGDSYYCRLREREKMSSLFSGRGEKKRLLSTTLFLPSISSTLILGSICLVFSPTHPSRITAHPLTLRRSRGAWVRLPMGSIVTSSTACTWVYSFIAWSRLEGRGRTFGPARSKGVKGGSVGGRRVFISLALRHWVGVKNGYPVGVVVIGCGDGSTYLETSAGGEEGVAPDVRNRIWGGGGGWSCLDLATCCGIDVRRRRQLGVCSRRLLDCQTANDTRMNEGVDNNIIFAC